MRPLPVRVPEAGYIALDLEVVADGEGEVRELLARGGRRGLRRRGENEAVAEGPGVGRRGGLAAAQPPPAAPRGLREDDDPGDGDARDDPGARGGIRRGAAGARSGRGVHGGGGGGLGF